MLTQTALDYDADDKFLIAAKSDVLVPINCGLPKFDPKLWLA